MCPRLRVGDSGQAVFECLLFRFCVAILVRFGGRRQRWEAERCRVLIASGG